MPSSTDILVRVSTLLPFISSEARIDQSSVRKYIKQTAFRSGNHVEDFWYLLYPELSKLNLVTSEGFCRLTEGACLEVTEDVSIFSTSWSCTIRSSRVQYSYTWNAFFMAR